MRRVAPFFAAAVLAACASQPRPTSATCISGCVQPTAPALASDARDAFTVQQMPPQLFAAMDQSADSTTAFAIEMMRSVDVAVVQAITASNGLDLDGTKPAMRGARSALAGAGANADAVIRQGDRINALVSALPTAANRPWKTGAEFTRYWTKARHQLVIARNSAGQGVEAADEALSCRTLSCAKPRMTTVRQKSEALSAASYQAEPLVRIAMVYATSKFGTGL